MKACLKFGCAIDSLAQTKRVPSCTPAAPISRYPTIASPRPMPPATKIGQIAYLGQYLLGQYRCGDRADVAARFHALDDEGVRARTNQFLRQHQGRREADELRPAFFHPLDGTSRRQPAG